MHAPDAQHGGDDVHVESHCVGLPYNCDAGVGKALEKRVVVRVVVIEGSVQWAERSLVVCHMAVTAVLLLLAHVMASVLRALNVSSGYAHLAICVRLFAAGLVLRFVLVGGIAFASAFDVV